MLNLEKHIKLTKEVIQSPNLTDLFSDEDLKRIGEQCWDDYKVDVESREKWLRRTSAAMDLAMQVQKDKTFPWPGCSNIAFPLVTIAALQFHSRAYPAIVQAPNVVQCQVIGPDPDGKKLERAQRITCHMSWQRLEQDCDWEEQQDLALINVPIVGCAFKKSYYSAGKGYVDSDLVLAKDLVINYWSKNLDDMATHIIPLDKNDVHSRILEEVFRDIREENWYKEDAPQRDQTPYGIESDNRKGLEEPMPDARTPFQFLEQHRCMDLDGDGYAEPYIITIEESSHCVVRIVCRFDREQDIERTKKGEIIRIHPIQYFTKIPFIPSPDGGFYDIGFGVLLGPLNESTNGAINQLFDAGTMSNTAGGFLGRGVKIRGGLYNFSPFEWNRVDSTGDDLKKSIFPLPIREPSNVMFQLLSLLINYTEKISGAVDVVTGGNPGQNTPSTSMQEMVKQGQTVFAAIFKRIWRSMKEEFKKIYQLNGVHLPVDKVQFAGGENYISRGDYLGDPSAIIPAADPNIMSDQARLMQANALMAVGKGNPFFDQDEVYKNFLRALKIPNIDQVFLGKKRMVPLAPPEKVMVEQMKAQVQLQKLYWEKLKWISSLLEQRKLNEAKIVQLYAQAALLEQQAGGVKSAQQIQAFQAVIDSIKVMNEGIDNQIAQQAGIGGPDGQQNDQGNDQGGSGQGGAANVPGMEAPPGDTGTLPAP